MPPNNSSCWKGIVKEGRERKVWEFGHRLHLVVDANWELPIAKEVTLAEDNEKKATLPLLSKTRQNLPWFKPDAVMADKAYDKYDHYQAIVKNFDAEPIIKHVKHSEYEPSIRMPGKSRKGYLPAS